MSPTIALVILGVLTIGAVVYLVERLAELRAGRDLKLARIGADAAIPRDEVELAIHRAVALAGQPDDPAHLERVEALVLEDLDSGAIARELDAQDEDLAP